MSALVRSRAQEPSYDFRTAGAGDALFDRLGPGHASGAVPERRPAGDAAAASARVEAKARNGAAAKA